MSDAEVPESGLSDWGEGPQPMTPARLRAIAEILELGGPLAERVFYELGHESRLLATLDVRCRLGRWATQLEHGTLAPLAPGNEVDRDALTSERLREIAELLDESDNLVRALALDSGSLYEPGNEVQTDIRRWADEIDAGTFTPVNDRGPTPRQGRAI